MTARCAVVGLGYWGPNLLRALSDLPDTEVTMVCDLDEGRLAHFARRYPAVQMTTSFDEVLESEDVDAVIIATPVFTHYELGMAAIAAGKHVFVEKPLAPSTAEADELLKAAADAGLVLLCGHTFLYSPPVRKIRALLDEGALGDLFFVSSSRVNLGLHQRDVSVVWDLGPHDFSMLLYWLEEMPSRVRAVGQACIVAGIPDVAFITLTFPSGIIASVELSWLAPSKLRRTVIAGSEKMVVYEDGSAEAIRIYDHGVVYEDPETFGEYHLSYRTGDVVAPKLASGEPLVAEMSDFTQAVLNSSPMDEHATLARNVVRITEAVDRSLMQGGIEVELQDDGLPLLTPSG